MKKANKMFVFPGVTILILIFGLYAFAPHPPAAPKHVESVTELESYFNQLVWSGSPPGLSVVIVKDGEMVFNRAFGYSDGPCEVKATPETVYHWWSMTKIPTAIAILQLQEHGKLNLDDEVAAYLPWFKVKSSTPILVRHLLQHTSGLPDTMPSMIGWVHYDDTTRSQTEIAKNYLPEFNRLKFEPGEKAVYSNLNYMILGALIEVSSGQSYETYITENILQPLGMSQTNFVYTHAMADHEAFGTLPLVHYYTPLLPFLLDTRALFRERDGKLFWMNRVYIDATPSTGLLGSASDVARFMIGYLTGFINIKVPLLSSESLSTLNEIAPLDGHGLGWSMGKSNEVRYLEHAGGGPGFAAVMRIYPDLNLGIAILANGTDLDREGLMELIGNMDW